MLGRSDMSSTRWADDRLFNAAWAYDLAFAWDIQRELDTLIRIARLDTDTGARVLLPACGTGRFAAAMAQRGFVVDASDINPEMLAWARERHSHANVSYTLGDMTQPLGRSERDCVAAFSLCNSFRYILEERAVASHLRAVLTRLRPGGVYVIELALNPVADDVGLSNRWALQYPSCRVEACWTLASLTPPTSLEIAEIRIEHGENTHEFREEQPQRVWSHDQLVDAVELAGFAVQGIHELSGRRATDPARPDRYYVALRRPDDQMVTP
jgi:SAM-dependent methyltransferase